MTSSRKTVAVLSLALLLAAPLAISAADGFTDVPDSNVFKSDIDWMADAGVTKGCNPPDNTEFCPSDNVTREQMAAFMHRLADNQVVDAGELGGEAATAYQTIVAAARCEAVAVSGEPLTTECLPAVGGSVPTGTISMEVVKVELTVPTAGTLQLNGAALLDGELVLGFYIDKGCPTGAAAFYAEAAGTAVFGSDVPSTAAGHVTTMVDAGSHTIRMCVANGEASASQVTHANMTAQWNAGGSVDVKGAGS